MQSEEKIYLRESLGRKCTSEEIAYSFLEGRVDKNEHFALEGKSISFAELFLQDAIVRRIIRTQGDPKELFPKEDDKFDKFSTRYDLFKKIVLRGDDSIGRLLLELDEKTERLEQLQKESQEDKTQLRAYKKQNDELIAACNNDFNALQEFSVIISGQMQKLEPQSELYTEYKQRLSILKSLTEELCKRLKTNLSSATSSESQRIEKVRAIDEYRELTERECKNTVKELERRKKQEQQAIERAREKLQQERQKTSEELAQKRLECEQQLAKQKCRANSAIANELNKLSAQMLASGKLDEKLHAEARKLFGNLPDCQRLYVCNEAPFPAALCNAIKNVAEGDVSPKSVLAFFDCSFWKNGTSGILVATTGIYLFNDGKSVKVPLSEKNKFALGSASELEGFNIAILLICGLLICYLLYSALGRCGLVLDGVGVSIFFYLINLPQEVVILRSPFADCFFFKFRDNEDSRYFEKFFDTLNRFIASINAEEFWCPSEIATVVHSDEEG